MFVFAFSCCCCAVVFFTEFLTFLFLDFEVLGCRQFVGCVFMGFVHVCAVFGHAFLRCHVSFHL